jgi:hypothetical protein
MIKRMINAFGREAANEKAACVGFRFVPGPVNATVASGRVKVSMHIR